MDTFGEIAEERRAVADLLTRLTPSSVQLRACAASGPCTTWLRTWSCPSR